ncbi:hypothetical protein TNCV_1986381 [Trichonephila clavipes]|nr:hypothetical protein TNCV_1986381 [Trichonephila clavipes]
MTQRTAPGKTGTWAGSELLRTFGLGWGLGGSGHVKRVQEKAEFCASRPPDSTGPSPNLPTSIKAGYLNCKIRPYIRILCAVSSARVKLSTAKGFRYRVLLAASHVGIIGNDASGQRGKVGDDASAASGYRYRIHEAPSSCASWLLLRSGRIMV